MPVTRQQKRKTRRGRGAERERGAAGAAKAAGRQRSARQARGRAARTEGKQARSELPAHAYVQISTARLCAKSEGSPPEKPGAGEGKAPQPPAAAASPVLTPGQRRSGAQAKRLVGRGSPPLAAAGFTAPRGRRSASRAAARAQSRPPQTIATSERGAGSEHTPGDLQDPALWRCCWWRAAAAPQGSPGSYCLAARIALPVPQPSPPGGWVGMYARCVEREYTTDTCKREI